jgi:predicted phosphatase
MNYNQWKHCMKYYLYYVSSEVWQVGCDGVDFLDDAEQPTSDQLQKIYCNAQAISIPTSLIDKEEFNHVDGLDVAKDVWDTLRMAHEGSRPVRKANIEMLEGQLNRFVMFDDESPQDMFNQLQKMVNKTKALGSKNWNYRMLTKRLMRAYTPMNYNVVVLIHQHPTYKKMTSDNVLRRIKNHEMCIQEVNHIKNLYVGVTTTKKREIAFNATKKSKNKQVVVESSCEEEEEEEEEEKEKEEEEEEDSSECYAEEMALFMRKFKKYMSKKKFSKGDKKFNTKSTTKRIWYNCGKHGHLIANCPFEHREEDDDKKKVSSIRKTRATKGMISLTRRSPMGKLTLVKNECLMMRAPTPIVMVCQP